MTDLVERNIAAVRAGYERIRPVGGPFFDQLDGGTRAVAFAAAVAAESTLRQALQEIADMETATANATVRRMAARARKALNA